MRDGRTFCRALLVDVVLEDLGGHLLALPPSSPATAGRPGELAIVLHAHMPYVEGFGTWPFGEEWLWESVATSYLPLLDVLGRLPVTLSLTPVLCDQLEAPDAIDRCLGFLREIRLATHELDIAAARSRGESDAVAELERSAACYAAAADRLEALGPGGGLLAALGAHASWTSAATHPILPLLASDLGIALQLQTGIGSHRRRFGDWGGGLWLPECAYSPWLDEPLAEAGVRHSCVELTGLFGRGDRRHLAALQTAAGPLLWPIDRELIDRVWAPSGYPSAGPYRDRHRFTEHGHHVFSNDGTVYDHDRALAQTRADAEDFVRHAILRLATGGVCVCALDAELFGDWWHEGVDWLEAVIDQAGRRGLPLTLLHDAAASRHQPVPVALQLGVSSWGEGGDLRTWSGPRAAELAWRARSAELTVLALGMRPSDRTLRELLALQSSDWAFLHSRATAGDYPRQRADAHHADLHRALADATAVPPATARLRNLAPVLAGWGSGR